MRNKTILGEKYLTTIFFYLYYRPTFGLLINESLIIEKKMRIVKKHDDRKTEIVEVSEKLFNKNGYSKTPISLIIETIGIAKGTFYHYFKSKEDLLDEIIKKESAKNKERFLKIVNDKNLTAIQKINKLYGSSLDYRIKHKKLFKMLAKVLVQSDANLLLQHKRNAIYLEISTPLLTKVIVQGIYEKSFHTSAPQYIAKVILLLGVDVDTVYSNYLNKKISDEKINELLIMDKNFSETVHLLLGAEKDCLTIVFPDKVKQLFS